MPTGKCPPAASEAPYLMRCALAPPQDAPKPRTRVRPSMQLGRARALCDPRYCSLSPNCGTPQRARANRLGATRESDWPRVCPTDGYVQQCLSKSSRATSGKLGSARSGACVARLAGLPSVPLYKFYSLDGRGRRIEPAIEADCSDDALRSRTAVQCKRTLSWEFGRAAAW